MLTLEEYLRRMKRAADRGGYAVHASVLMTNHVDPLLTPEDAARGLEFQRRQKINFAAVMALWLSASGAKRISALGMKQGRPDQFIGDVDIESFRIEGSACPTAIAFVIVMGLVVPGREEFGIS